MSLYGFIAFLHVATGIVWVGGGFATVLLALRAIKARDDADLASIMKHIIYLSKLIFMPASVIMLVLGLYLTYAGGRGLFSFWILFAILGLVASGAMGGLWLSPMAKQYAALDQSSGPSPESTALAERFLSIAKADFVILFTVTFDMVVKPSWGNYLVWPLMLVVVAAGVFVFVPKDLLPKRPVGAS